MRVNNRLCVRGLVVLNVPFLFELGKDFPLGVVPDDASIDEAAQVELLCPKLRHGRPKDAVHRGSVALLDG
jgi:hypothetical protein